MNLYKGTFVKLYDTLFEPTCQEYAFYRYFLNSLEGSALEAACGTGQFLVEFLKEGYSVEGVDASKEMLDVCRTKARACGFEPVLHKHYMQSLSLKKQYTTLYVPSASFMLISEYNQAVEALKRFYEHILPGGQLLISLFVPWHERIDREGILSLRAEGIPFSLDTSVTWYESLTYDPINQLRKALYRFEYYTDNVLTKTEQTGVTWRWYGVHEFEALLKQVGFKDVALYGDYTLQEPTQASETLCFRAIKS